MLPVTITSSFPGEEQPDTIMSGIVYFWDSGSWVVATIIFIASFVVPLFKLAVMMLLLITVQRRSRWQLLQRTRLYRLVDLIGRWSMLDVFVVCLLSGLVQIRGFAEVHPGPGIAAFAAVVILTMLASMSFDPRLIWDAAESDDREPNSRKLA
jgi:paraquat-inducible protein A